MKQEIRPLSRKITVRMFLIYISIYLGTLLALFVLVRPRLEKEAERTVSNTLDLMSGELDNVLDTVTEYTNSILYSQDLSSLLKEYNDNPSISTEAMVNQALSRFVVANSYILTASLEDMEGHYFNAVYYNHICNKEAAHQNPRYRNLLSKQYGSFFSYLSPGEFIVEGVNAQYHVMEHTKIIQINQKKYILQLYANLSKAFRHMQILADGLFSDTAILYSDGEPAYLSGDFFNEEASMLKTLFPYHLTKDRKRISSGILFYRKDIDTGWILLGHSPYYYYDRTLISISIIVTLIYIISAVLYTLFLVRTIRHSLLPLEQLSRAMQDYSAGQETHMLIRTHDEFEILGGCFTEMTQKINHQVEDICEQEHVNAVINYKLLATQIDPHFIYNTMNIINIMAREGNTSAILEINSALIKILRERLNTKLTITDTVENERDTLYQYSRIMDYRYDNKIRLSVDVDNDLLPCQIPKNILQPLAENSFYHGFPSLAEGQEGHIDIMIYTIDGEMIIEISDDGAGIPPERLEMLRNQSYEIYRDKKPHIGLDNIRQRLAFIYPGQYQFDIQSTEGYGTTISISIPLIRQQ